MRNNFILLNNFFSRIHTLVNEKILHVHGRDFHLLKDCKVFLLIDCERPWILLIWCDYHIIDCSTLACFRLPEAPVAGRCRLCHRFWRSRSSVGSQPLTPRVISQQILVQSVTVGMWNDLKVIFWWYKNLKEILRW